MQLRYIWISFVVFFFTNLALAEFPEKPIRFVVAFAPGSSSDVLARIYAQALKESTGQPVIVEPRPGATGSIGADIVAKASPDGYTILMHSSAIVINPWLSKPNFNFATDLQPIIRTAHTPYFLVVNNSLPIYNLQDFVNYSKKNPGKLSCSSYGNGSPPHLGLELLKSQAQIDVVHIPYKGFGQALPDLISGRLDCSIEAPINVLQQVQAGNIRVIAHTGDKRHELMPLAQPFGELYPNAIVDGWQAIFVPAGTPNAIVGRLNSEFAKLLRNPDVIKKIKDTGFEPVGDTVSDFSQVMTSDFSRYGNIIKQQKIRAE
ncbi:MAG: tripartite tricarboxylate transporter substrate binding protein [Betaproteobacteria bacterium]